MLPRSSSNNVVITLTSWRGRVLLRPSAPLTPPFWLTTSVKCPIVRDRHDKRLRFFVNFFDRLSLTKSVVVLFFFYFPAKHGRFCISQKCYVAIRFFLKNFF